MNVVCHSVSPQVLVALESFKVREGKIKSRVYVHTSEDAALPPPDQKGFILTVKIRLR